MSMTERFGHPLVKLETRTLIGAVRHTGESLKRPRVMATDIDKGLPAEARSDRLKRRQILEGARRMFLAQGFDAASMGAIARQAGVSKGTLYVYFKSKEELFEAIVEEQCRAEAEQIFTLDRQA